MSIRTIVRILKLGAGTRKYKGGPRRTGTGRDGPCASRAGFGPTLSDAVRLNIDAAQTSTVPTRSEEHTSELQSLAYLVCRLLLEKKKERHQRRAIPDGCYPETPHRRWPLGLT